MGYDKVDKSIWFNTVDQNRNRITRLTDYGNNILRVKVPKTDLRRYSFSQRVVNDWNGLPVEIKDSVSIASFKNSLNNYVKDHVW